MELFLGILGIIISAIVSVIFSDKITDFLGIYLTRFDMKKKSDIEGLWLAEFTLNENGNISKYKEAIKIVKRLGTVYGYNVPHPENHEALMTVDKNVPLRVRAILVDNRYLTGNWFHPNKMARFHGSFQMIVRLSFTEMTGVWTGFSESKNSIDKGDWNWTRLS